MFHIFAVILFASAFLYFECRKFFTKRALTISGFAAPKHVPIFGVANRFIGKSNDELLDIFNEVFSEVPETPAQVWFGYQLIVCVADPINLQIVLNADQCINKPYQYQYIHCVTSIIATDRNIWRPHRRALNSSFNPKILMSYVPKLNEKAALLVDHVDSVVTNGSTIDLYHMVFKCMLDIVFCTTMGVEMEMQSPRGEFCHQVMKVLMANIQKRFVRVWLCWDFIYRQTSMYRSDLWALKTSEQLMRDVLFTTANKINQQKNDFLETGRQTNTLNVIEKCLLLQREGKLNEKNVFDQMSAIVTAGVDTSSIAIFSTILLLAIHQQHQDKVVKEICNVLESAECDVTYEHLSKMTYLECVIKEALRLFPPAPIFARQCSDDVEMSCGKIQKGTILVINVAHLHRNEKYWGPHSDRFDPERFSPENSRDRPSYSYLPFSGGPRNCIGMKYAYITVKIVAAHLLRRYKFTSNLKMEDIRTRYTSSWKYQTKIQSELNVEHFKNELKFK